jgi:hypothetical protein
VVTRFGRYCGEAGCFAVLISDNPKRKQPQGRVHNAISSSGKVHAGKIP